MAAFAPAGTVDLPTTEVPLTGREIGDWVDQVITGFPDLEFEEHNTPVADREKTWVVEWTLRGTHTGPFGRVPPTNKSITIKGIHLVELSEDGIESIKSYFDTASIAEQLGLRFPAIIKQLPTLVSGAIRYAG